MEQSHSERIASDIEEMILNRELADGDRLDEARLSERFGVSRTPLREALQRLAHTGLVELVPRRGAFVRQPGPVELIQMFEAMAELEASCGRLSALRISDAALINMREANELCRAALEAGDSDRYFIENEHFHGIIYAQSGNGYLQQKAMQLHRRLRPFRRMQLRLRGRMKQSMAEHEEIVDRLAAGDQDGTAKVLRSHVAVQGDKFHALMAGLHASMN
ncbi:MAG: GntR family transcriptional regulator [Pseudorhodobacter sp.]